jgi:hypothetical protein
MARAKQWRQMGGLYLAALLSATAAPPALDHLYPVAIQAGTTQQVNVIGKVDPWPPKVWVDSPGIHIQPLTNSGLLSIQVDANLPPAAHAIRLFNDEGASPIRVLVTTSQPQTAETEPNDHFKKPQRISQLPAAINGRLDKSGDVDSYSIELRENQTVIAFIEAFVLASPIDAVLRIIDSKGVQVALNHDDGKTFDPFIAWTAQTAGTYILQVFGFPYPAGSDVRFAGSSSSVYRLLVSGGAFVHHTLPLGIPCGKTAKVQGIGWNFPAGQQVWTEWSGGACSPDVTTQALQFPGAENLITVQIGQGSETLETEPNDAITQAAVVTLPGAITGTISNPGDVDRYLFQAQKGDLLEFQVRSASLGFPMDPWLRLEDKAGKELTRSDDGPNADPIIEWTAPETASYQAVVGNLLRRGNADCLYRLNLERRLPKIGLSVAASAFSIKAGETNEIPVTLKRLNGDTRPLKVSLRGLPAGLTCESMPAPEKAGELKLKLVAAKDAKPASAEIQIVGIEEKSGSEQTARFSIVATGTDNGVPNGFHKLLVESVDRLWLTVLPPPPAKP